jgi:hypothetical protein
VRRLTLLSGPLRPLPSRARRWIGRQPAYVAVEVVDPQSAAAARRFPGLAGSAAADLVAVSDAGAVWTGPAAWTMALWALRPTREDALWLERRGLRARARDHLLALVGREETPFGEERPTPFQALCVAIWAVGALVLLPLSAGLAAAVALVALFLGGLGGYRGLARATLLLGAWGLGVFAARRTAPDLSDALAVSFLPLFLVVVFFTVLSRGSAPARDTAGGTPRG